MEKEPNRFNFLEFDDIEPPTVKTAVAVNSTDLNIDLNIGQTKFTETMATPILNYYQIAVGDDLLGPITSNLTAFRVKMSPRMSQFYSMLAYHNIPIRDFSTDNCVENCLPKLNALADKLRQNLKSIQRVAMLQDLEGLMRRRPAHRIKRQ